VFGALLGSSRTFVEGLQVSFVIAASLLVIAAIANTFLPRVNRDQ
jgi:hypothetical protein